MMPMDSGQVADILTLTSGGKVVLRSRSLSHTYSPSCLAKRGRNDDIPASWLIVQALRWKGRVLSRSFSVLFYLSD